MKRLLFGAGTICISLGVYSCGGGDSSRGLSQDIPVFNTVTVSIVASKRPGSPEHYAVLESDVIKREPLQTYVRSGQNCNVQTTTTLCIVEVFEADDLILTFRSSTVKNAQGAPVTQNPSPVLVEKYKVSFTGCIPGVYDFPVSQVLAPDRDTDITIQPITQDMKRAILQRRQCVYIGQDGCRTQFNIAFYPGICNAIANFEFSLVELSSGLRRTIRYSLPIRITDAPEEQCPIPIIPTPAQDECLIPKTQ